MLLIRRECENEDGECAGNCSLEVIAMQTNSRFAKKICGLYAENCEPEAKNARGTTQVLSKMCGCMPLMCRGLQK